MFETSAIRLSRNRRATRLLYMPLSIALHAFAVVAFVIGTVWAVDFPAASPAQMRGFSIATTPPLPPAAPLARGTRSPARQVTSAPVTPRADVAPVIIPDQVVPVEPSPEPEGDRDGVIGGIADGARDGIIGGADRDLVPADPAPPDDVDTIHRVRGEVRAPVAIFNPPPTYPQLAVNVRIEGSVVLACVIDSSGVVRDVTVVRADHPVLAPAAVDAVRKWRFRPGVLHGKPIHTLYELTVHFRLR